MCYHLEDTPRLMHLVHIGTPPRESLARKPDVHHADDWIAERMDALRAWVRIKDTPAGLILAGIFRDCKPAAEVVERHAPPSSLSTEIWVRVAAGAFLTACNEQE